MQEKEKYRIQYETMSAEDKFAKLRVIYGQFPKGPTKKIEKSKLSEYGGVLLDRLEVLFSLSFTSYFFKLRMANQALRDYLDGIGQDESGHAVLPSHRWLQKNIYHPVVGKEVEELEYGDFVQNYSADYFYQVEFDVSKDTPALWREAFIAKHGVSPNLS